MALTDERLKEIEGEVGSQPYSVVLGLVFEIRYLRKELKESREAAIDECLRIVKAECELPGPMPDEMWEAIKDDKDAAAELARIGVRKTKWNIAVAIDALKAVGVNQAAG